MDGTKVKYMAEDSSTLHTLNVKHVSDAEMYGEEILERLDELEEKLEDSQDHEDTERKHKVEPITGTTHAVEYFHCPEKGAVTVSSGDVGKFLYCPLCGEEIDG